MAALAVMTSPEKLPKKADESTATDTTDPATKKTEKSLPNRKLTKEGGSKIDERRWITQDNLAGHGPWQIPSVVGIVWAGNGNDQDA